MALRCSLLLLVLLAVALVASALPRQKRGLIAVSPLHGIPVKVRSKDEGQDFSKIPGVPGVDYPIYHSVPPTSFHCGNVPFAPGMYANVETGCQAYHVCHDGREGEQGASFLCTNGTLFNQKEFACDWWYNVDCHSAPSFYSLNLDPLKNPYVPKPKVEEVVPVAPIAAVKVYGK